MTALFITFFQRGFYMALGFFHNVFEQAGKVFRKAGRTFKELTSYIRQFTPDKEQAVTFIRRQRENRMFERAKPFVAELPSDLNPTESLYTPTTLMLRAKNQYLFNVKFRYSDRPLDEFEYLSFVTDDVLTKAEAEKRMGQILLERRNKETYPNLKSIEMALTGTRTRMW